MNRQDQIFFNNLVLNKSDVRIVHVPPTSTAMDALHAVQAVAGKILLEGVETLVRTADDLNLENAVLLAIEMPSKLTEGILRSMRDDGLRILTIRGFGEESWRAIGWCYSLGIVIDLSRL